ncbi:MAG: two-component hybrid sensor and regulator [Myxococcales bacterium]|nr:two-component hybrid sensor and regulator [Myxococcales bacterium]
MGSTEKPTSAEPIELGGQKETLERDLDRRVRVERASSDQLDPQRKKNGESEQLFRLLIESVQDYAIFILDENGKVATWNAGAQCVKGYTADEIIGRHFSVFYPDVDVRAGKCDHELDVAARFGRFEDEGWRVRKDGSMFWANVVITALRSSTGKLLGFGKVTRDLTERKRAEEQRRASDERFRLLVASIRDYAIFILNPDGTVATWNAGAQRIKGYTADEIIGSHFSRFYLPDEVRAGKCELELEAAAREGRFEDEGWRIRKDGSKFWGNVVISAIRDDLGQLVGYSKVTRDLTDRIKSESERAARVAAEQSNKTKDEFLAMLGHELRNPLAPIVSALQLLKIRGDTKSLREYQIIDRQVRQMIHLVDDLLDISRISRAKIELKREPLDVRDPLGKAVEIAIPLFETKSQYFEVEIPDDPLVMAGDEARLTQVFANLLNNAAKYTPQGGNIRLRVQHAGEMIVIEIHDDGIGMDAALLPRVFELFVQGYQDAARAAGGLGVGLTLVRSLVELHGGSVEARSKGLGKGSSFIVRLPGAPQPAPDAADERLAMAFPPAEKASYRILIVDDNDDARLLLADILTSLGHHVKTADDGPSALVTLAEFKPQFAILDIGLPGMDGYELAAELRKSPEGDRIRLIALSGYGQPADRARSQRLGFDDHLVKPADVNRLLERLVKPLR